MKLCVDPESSSATREVVLSVMWICIMSLRRTPAMAWREKCGRTSSAAPCSRQLRDVCLILLSAVQQEEALADPVMPTPELRVTVVIESEAAAFLLLGLGEAFDRPTLHSDRGCWRHRQGEARGRRRK
jgi:hypothetical protein